MTALQAGHAEQLDEQQRHADHTIGEIQQAARVAVEEANAGRDHAEGTAAELRAELEAARSSADAALAAARDQAAAAYRALAEQLASRFQAELEAARAKSRGADQPSPTPGGMRP